MSIKCQALDCAHNGHGACYAGSIIVHGNQAHTTSQTACHNYVCNSNAHTEFASEFGLIEHQTKTTNIKCHARNCSHNQNLACHANRIQINANTASCETFED